MKRKCRNCKRILDGPVFAVRGVIVCQSCHDGFYGYAEELKRLVSKFNHDDTIYNQEKGGEESVATKTITICDGCSAELRHGSNRFHIDMRSDSFWDGVETDDIVHRLVFCEACALSLKQTLEQVEKGGRA